MASIRELSPALWRSRLREASFKGAPFHVEQQARTSGQRTVLHEYPKRDIPWAESMGRHARRYQVTGYVIQKRRAPGGSAFDPNYDLARDALVRACESRGPGTLVDPYNNRVGPLLFMCERYTMTESRERGGYAQFEMQFVEAGLPTFQPGGSTEAAVDTAADLAVVAASKRLDAQQGAARDNASKPQQGPATFDERFQFPTQ